MRSGCRSGDCDLARAAPAVRFRAADAVEADVNVAEHREDEAMMDSNTVGDKSLNDRKNCASNDRHRKNSRTASRLWAEFSQSQAEDGRKHDGIEEPDGEHAPHRCVSA